jgi:AcrR family transcriptional regulator
MRSEGTVSGEVGGTHKTRRRRHSDPSRMNPSLDAAILRAALAGFAEHGYDRLSMDDIAAGAHVGKAAIYRRWRSKADVAAAAITWWREQQGPEAAPDTGSLRGDIEALIAGIPHYDDADLNMSGVILGAAAAASRDPALAAVLDEQVLAWPRQVLSGIFAAAVARGEIPPGRDLSLVPDVFFGLTVLQMIKGKPGDRAFSRRVFEEIVLPLAAAPDA